MRWPVRQTLYCPWVDRTARHISDPVFRLRYLQAVTPPVKSSSWPARCWKTALLSLLCVFLVGAVPPTQAVVEAHPAPLRYAVPAAPKAAPVPPSIWIVENGRDFE